MSLIPKEEKIDPNEVKVDEREAATGGLIPKKEKIDPNEMKVDEREAATGGLIPKKEKIDPEEEKVDEREAANVGLIPKKEKIDPEEEKVDEREAANGTLIPKQEKIVPEEEKVDEPGPSTARNRNPVFCFTYSFGVEFLRNTCSKFLSLCRKMSLIPKQEKIVPEEEKIDEPGPATARNRKRAFCSRLSDRKPGKKSPSESVGLRGTGQIVPSSDNALYAHFSNARFGSEWKVLISDTAPVNPREMTEFFEGLSPLLRGRLTRGMFYRLRHQINRSVLILLHTSKPAPPGEAATGTLIPKQEKIVPEEEKVNERKAATGTLIPKQEKIVPEEEKVDEPGPSTARNRKRAFSSTLSDHKPGKKSPSESVGLRGTGQIVPSSDTALYAHLSNTRNESEWKELISYTALVNPLEMTAFFEGLSPLLRGRITRGKFHQLRQQIIGSVLRLLNTSKPAPPGVFPRQA